MKTLSATDVARNFSAVLDRIERDQEEVILVRNRRPVARLVPEPPAADALSVLGDLYRTLDDGTAERLAAAIRRGRRRMQGRVSELRNPWAG
jgi:prevent-host-death family protein